MKKSKHTYYSIFRNILCISILLSPMIAKAQLEDGYLADSSNPDLYAIESVETTINYYPPSVQDFDSKHVIIDTDYLTRQGSVARVYGESQEAADLPEGDINGLVYDENGMEVVIYYPVKDDTNTDCSSPLPILVYGYGGGFILPIDDQEYDVAEWFAKRGYIVVVPKYRIGMCLYEEELSKRAIWRALQDMKVIIRWARGGLRTAFTDAYCTDPELPLTYVGWSAGALIGLHNFYMSEEDGDDAPRADAGPGYFDRPYGTTGHYEYEDIKRAHKRSGIGKNPSYIASVKKTYTTYDLGKLNEPTYLRDTDNNSDYYDFLNESSLPDISVCVSGGLGESSWISNNDPVPRALLLIHDFRDGVVPYEYGQPFVNLGAANSSVFTYPWMYGSFEVNQKIKTLDTDNIPELYRFTSISGDLIIQDPTHHWDKDKRDLVDYQYPQSLDYYYIDGESGGEAKAIGIVGEVALAMVGKYDILKTWRHSPMEYGGDQNVMESIKTFIDYARDDYNEKFSFVPLAGQTYTIQNEDGSYLASDGESDSPYAAREIPEDDSAYDLLWYFIPSEVENEYTLLRAYGGSKPVLSITDDLASPIMAELSSLDGSQKFNLPRTSDGEAYMLDRSDAEDLNAISISYSDAVGYVVFYGGVNEYAATIRMNFAPTCINDIYTPTAIGGLFGSKSDFSAPPIVADCNSETITMIIIFNDKGNITGTEQELLDADVNQAYIDEIIDKYEGEEVYSTSRWLNAVHLKLPLQDFLSDPFPLESIKSWWIVPGPVTYDLPEEGPIGLLSDGSITTANQTELLGIDQMDANGFRGKGVKIGVMDLGFPKVNRISAFGHLSNDDLDDGEITNVYNYYSNDTNVYTGNKHGTKVLSVLAATHDLFGANPEVPVYRGASPEAEYALCASFSDQITSLDLVVYNAVRSIEDLTLWGANVINNSTGLVGNIFEDINTTFWTKEYNKAMETAASRGVIIAQAVGNDGTTEAIKDNGIRVPAGSVGILSVTGVDTAGIKVPSASYATEAMFSAKSKPDVCALGINVAVIDPDSESIVLDEGTSYATPAVAGFAANILQQYGLNSTDVINGILQTSSLADTPNRFLGHGIPSYEKMLSTFTPPSEANLLAVNTKDTLISNEPLSIHPNPTAGTISIVMPSAIREGTEIFLQLYTLTGVEIASKKITKNTKTIKWNLDENGPVPNGLYILNVLSTGYNGSAKVLIE